MTVQPSRQNSTNHTSLRADLAFLSEHAAPNVRLLALLALLVVGGAAATLAGPLLLARFIDAARLGAADRIALASALYLGTAILIPLLTVAETWVATSIAWRSTNRIRTDLFAHCLRQDVSFVETHAPGAMIERIDGDVGLLSEFLSTFAISIVTAVLVLLGVFFVMASIDWRLAALLAGFLALLFLLLRYSRSRGEAKWQSFRTADAREMGTLEELLAGTEDLRSNGATAWALDRYSGDGWAAYVANRAALVFGTGTFATGSLLYGWASASCLAMATWLHYRGGLTVGTVYLVFAYATAAQGPFESINRQLRTLQSVGAGLARLRELLGTTPQIIWPAHPKAVPSGLLDVAFDSVRFSYEGGGETLKNVSFRLEPGRVLGLLGRTGAGKSTLAKLLMRFHDPDAGEVRIGGVNLRDMDEATMRHLVAYVPQDVQLLHATVRENLTLFDPSIDDRRLLELLDFLDLRPWLEALPAGLDSMVAPGGRDVSAGQAQLLAAARAFLLQPRLVVLDEASSRIDPAGEARLQHAFDHLFSGRTAVVIAHRLQTIRHVDDIMVLEGGEILEYGPRGALESDPDSRFATLLRHGMSEVLG